MRKTGIAIIIIGLLITAFTGFGFFAPMNMPETDSPENTIHNSQQIHWAPYAGVALFLAGGLVFLTGIKKLE
jgi:quinol-cytochrome oxidoreductase complex cytochrome b subunit